MHTEFGSDPDDIPPQHQRLQNPHHHHNKTRLKTLIQKIKPPYSKTGKANIKTSRNRAILIADKAFPLANSSEQINNYKSLFLALSNPLFIKSFLSNYLIINCAT